MSGRALRFSRHTRVAYSQARGAKFLSTNSPELASNLQGWARCDGRQQRWGWVCARFF